MTVKDFTSAFPRVTDNGDGTVSLKLGKVTFTEWADHPLLNVETKEETIILHMKMWCLRNGINTWDDLLANKTALDAFHAKTEDMTVEV